MASKDMVALGAQSSVIRDLFAYGQAQAAIVGKENVFDFSIGNPAVPPPDSVAEAICHIVQSEPAVGVHGYTMAAGDRTVREGLAAYMNKTYQAQVTADNFYMTCGAAASLTISLKALVENATDEIILVAPFFFGIYCIYKEFRGMPGYFAARHGTFSNIAGGVGSGDYAANGGDYPKFPQ